MSGEVHGEVDEKSWHLKQTLLRRPMNARKDGKPFREYARQSFEDTMTLYLHGICCDIDVETGPRQLPSRHLRRRLEAVQRACFRRRKAMRFFRKTRTISTTIENSETLSGILPGWWLEVGEILRN